MRHLIAIVLFCLISFGSAFAQNQEQPNNLVQFSGMVLDGSTQELFPVPYTNILVIGKGRGTYSDYKGFFSIVVEKGDTIEFSAVGYETVQYFIPKDLEDSRYSLVQLMTQDVINLPTTVVFPWPSREHFKLEFLAMDVTSDLQERASQNLAQESLDKMRETVLADGDENADYYLRKQAARSYYVGQQPPMNIFNPIAWKKFFDAWKRGDYKKK